MAQYLLCLRISCDKYLQAHRGTAHRERKAERFLIIILKTLCAEFCCEFVTAETRTFKIKVDFAEGVLEQVSVQ